MDILEEARKVIDIEIEALQGLRCRLDQSFEQAIDLLYNCQGRVVVSGLGKSGLIGRKIASTFASTGTPAVFLHPSEGVHGDLGIIKRDDVVILISNSGETEETLQIIPTLRRIDVKLIALTGRTSSTLCEYADVVINIGVEREACPNNLAPTASTTVMLALGDALAIVLLKKKGFNHEDFAFLHPGGSIGKRLLTKVDDVMFQGADAPFVSPDTIMENAIIEMTSKGLGAVLVVDNEKIEGVRHQHLTLSRSRVSQNEGVRHQRLTLSLSLHCQPLFDPIPHWCRWPFGPHTTEEPRNLMKRNRQ